MSNVKRWAYINKTFKNHSRSAVIRKYFMSTNRKKQREYWYYLIFYFGVSIVALYFSSQYFAFANTAIFMASFISYILIEKKLSRDFSSLYEEHNVGDYPFFERARQFSYLLFKEQLDKDSKIKAEDVSVLLEWNDINNEKVDRMIFFRSKYTLMIVTAVVAVIMKYLIDQELSTNTVTIAIFLMLLLLMVSWFIFDFSNFTKDRNLQITRFLKWYKIEKSASALYIDETKGNSL